MTLITQVTQLVEDIVSHLYLYTRKLEKNLHDNYFTKTEIENMRENSWEIAIVTELPVTGDANHVYLVEGTGPDTNLGVYDEYIWDRTNNRFEKLGNTEFDMKNYYKKDEINALLDGKLFDTTYWIKEFGQGINDERYIKTCITTTLNHKPNELDNEWFTPTDSTVITDNNILTEGKVHFQDVTSPLEQSWAIEAIIKPVSGSVGNKLGYIGFITPSTPENITTLSGIYYRHTGGSSDSDWGGGRRESFELGFHVYDDNVTTKKEPTRNELGSNDFLMAVDADATYYVRIEYKDTLRTFYGYIGTSRDNMIMEWAYRKPVQYDVPEVMGLLNGGDENAYAYTDGGCNIDLKSVNFYDGNVAINQVIKTEELMDSNLFIVPTVQDETTNAFTDYDEFLYVDGYELLGQHDLVHLSYLEDNYYDKNNSYSKEEFEEGIDTWNADFIDALPELQATNPVTNDYWDRVCLGDDQPTEIVPDTETPDIGGGSGGLDDDKPPKVD